MTRLEALPTEILHQILKCMIAEDVECFAMVSKWIRRTSLPLLEKHRGALHERYACFNNYDESELVCGRRMAELLYLVLTDKRVGRHVKTIELASDVYSRETNGSHNPYEVLEGSMYGSRPSEHSLTANYMQVIGNFPRSWNANLGHKDDTYRAGILTGEGYSELALLLLHTPNLHTLYFAGPRKTCDVLTNQHSSGIPNILVKVSSDCSHRLHGLSRATQEDTLRPCPSVHHSPNCSDFRNEQSLSRGF